MSVASVCKVGKLLAKIERKGGPGRGKRAIEVRSSFRTRTHKRSDRMSAIGGKADMANGAAMSANDPKRTLAPVASEIAERRRASLQFAPPKLCFQSLITPGGNSRLTTPVRRQASGHISSKK